MKDLISKVEDILKNKGFKKTAEDYCSTINGVFFDVRLGENNKEKKVYVSLSLLKDSYFEIYMRVRGIDKVRLSSKEKLLGSNRIGLINIYEDFIPVNDESNEQQFVDAIIQRIERMVNKYARLDINDFVISGKYKPYYKTFALIDSHQIDAAIALCKECISRGLVDLYVDNAGRSFYQYVIDNYSTEKISKISNSQVSPITTSKLDDVLLDNVEWHYASAEKRYCLTHNVPSELLSDDEISEINRLAGYHIGLFFHWLIDKDFVSNAHKASNSSELQKVLEYRRLGVEYLIDYCGGKLIKEDICDDVADTLFDFYVKDGGYLNLYADFIRKDLHKNEYDVTLTAEEFKVFEQVLNKKVPF